MGADLARAKKGKKTRTGMSQAQLRDFAKKPVKKKARKPVKKVYYQGGVGGVRG
jgi:hypothetical protein